MSSIPDLPLLPAALEERAISALDHAEEFSNFDRIPIGAASRTRRISSAMKSRRTTMNQQQNQGGASQNMDQAFGEILQGCATCCDGTLRAAQSSGADAEVTRMIEQARDLCNQAAQRAKSATR